MHLSLNLFMVAYLPKAPEHSNNINLYNTVNYAHLYRALKVHDEELAEYTEAEENCKEEGG
jgi:hypothetical protein